jgi:integral membrane protein (TIGR01906 family)
MRAVALALFVIAFAVSGLVVFALLWSGTGPYADLARDNHVQSITFIRRDGQPLSLDLAAVLDVHRKWSSYVTGATDAPPTFEADVRFSDDEHAHMADVRGVFEVARFLVPLGLFVLIIRLQRARAVSSREMWRMARDGSLIAALAVALIGVVAVFAFEPLFLAFHYVFFPQGNFLFDPATSNLIRLYPDWYWEGISLRVGLSFAAAALVVAAVAELRLRGVK